MRENVSSFLLLIRSLTEPSLTDRECSFLTFVTPVPSCVSVLFFASFFFCCLSIFLHPKKTLILSKTLVYYCFLVFRHISLDLFYFVNLISGCSLTSLTESAFPMSPPRCLSSFASFCFSFTKGRCFLQVQASS